MLDDRAVRGSFPNGLARNGSYWRSTFSYAIGCSTVYSVLRYYRQGEQRRLSNVAEAAKDLADVSEFRTTVIWIPNLMQNFTNHNNGPTMLHVCEVDS
jgi:hypothetical protein